MTLEWVAALPALLVAVLLVFLPGMAALFGVGLRGLSLAAFAPAMSVAMITVSGLLLGALHVPWTAMSLTLVLVALAGLAWLVGWLVMRVASTTDTAETLRWLLPVTIVVGVAFGVWRLATYIHDPAGISQTNDAVFHLNAVRYILETQDASVLHVSGVIGASSFYPAAWHAIVSAVVLLSGVEIAVAANVLTLVIGAGVWTLGIAWLARVATGSSTIAGYAALFAASLQTFPLLMFQWGVLYPNALSTALIPAGVAVVMSLPRWLSRSRPVRSAILGTLLVGVALGALLLAQPAAALPWGLLSAVWFAFWIVRRGRPRPLAARLGLAALPLLVLIPMWTYFSGGTSGSHWPPFRNKAEVWLDILFNGQMGIPAAIGVSVFMLVGLVIAARNRDQQWIVGGWLGLSALYVLVAAVGAPIVRDGLLAAWYADPYRLASLAPIAVVPLAAIGFNAVVQAVAQKASREVGTAHRDRVRLVGSAVAAVGMIVLIMLRPVAMPLFLDGTFDPQSRYIADSDSYLDPDERLLLESLTDYVPEGERVIANPSTGSGFGYMLSGYDVYPRTWSPPNSDEWDILAQNLRDAASDPEVCAALGAFEDPEYVLDFGPGEDRPGRWLMPGMTDFEGQPGFELVTSVGDASLWRITACAF
ncbi:DUF6541 family protein [Microbacterium sp. NPDC076768]|uniref:DUF6541 family protein n=1 Tax=Microbacterium sp. NPDC076768 TaxID=3154858 RepID=UPI0034200C60